MHTVIRSNAADFMTHCTRSSATAETARVSGHYVVQGHSRSLIDSNRRPVWDFLVVTFIHLASCSSDRAVYIIMPLTKECLSLTHSFAVISLNIAISLRHILLN